MQTGVQAVRIRRISEKDLALFKGAGPIIMSDGFGTGEILFARKFSYDAREIIAKIADIMKQKEKRV